MMSDDVIFPRTQPNWVLEDDTGPSLSLSVAGPFGSYFSVCANCRRSIIGRFFGRYKALLRRCFISFFNALLSRPYRIFSFELIASGFFKNMFHGFEKQSPAYHTLHRYHKHVDTCFSCVIIIIQYTSPLSYLFSPPPSHSPFEILLCNSQPDFVYVCV
jgi:hypothetical protein